MEQSPGVRGVCEESLLLAALVVTVEENGHTHHNEEHYDVLHGWITFVTEENTQNQYWDGFR